MPIIDIDHQTQEIRFFIYTVVERQKALAARRVRYANMSIRSLFLASSQISGREHSIEISWLMLHIISKFPINKNKIKMKMKIQNEVNNQNS